MKIIFTLFLILLMLAFMVFVTLWIKHVGFTIGG